MFEVWKLCDRALARAHVNPRWDPYGSALLARHAIYFTSYDVTDKKHDDVLDRDFYSTSTQQVVSAGSPGRVLLY